MIFADSDPQALWEEGVGTLMALGSRSPTETLYFYFFFFFLKTPISWDSFTQACETACFG